MADPSTYGRRWPDGIQAVWRSVCLISVPASSLRQGHADVPVALVGWTPEFVASTGPFSRTMARLIERIRGRAGEATSASKTSRFPLPSPALIRSQRALPFACPSWRFHRHPLLHRRGRLRRNGDQGAPAHSSARAERPLPPVECGHHVGVPAQVPSVEQCLFGERLQVRCRLQGRYRGTVRRQPSSLEPPRGRRCARVRAIPALRGTTPASATHGMRLRRVHHECPVRRTRAMLVRRRHRAQRVRDSR